MNDEGGVLQFRHREYTRSHPRQHLYCCYPFHTWEEKISVEKIVLFNLKLQKLKKVDMTDLFKLLNLFFIGK